MSIVARGNHSQYKDGVHTMGFTWHLSFALNSAKRGRGEGTENWKYLTKGVLSLHPNSAKVGKGIISHQ